MGEDPGALGTPLSHRLGVTRVRPRALDGSGRPNFRMLKNTSIGGVSKKL